MNQALVILVIINFAYIGILPRIFFRKDGRYNLMWWITAGPLFINAIILIAVQFAGVELYPQVEIPTLAQEILVPLLTAISIGNISLTLGTHRVPLSLWHQNNDKPVSIVTWGAYKHIRHPFYTSFIITQVASIILLPHVLTLAVGVLSYLVLNSTAAREEKNLSASEFGSEYVAYKQKTGRFLPKLV